MQECIGGGASVVNTECACDHGQKHGESHRAHARSLSAGSVCGLPDNASHHIADAAKLAAPACPRPWLLARSRAACGIRTWSYSQV
eukprot:1723639-Rhodomonas_salina.2